MEGNAPAFGTLLRRYRQAQGWTQEALAERAGVSKRNLGDLERGRPQRPRSDTVGLLATALNLSAQERRAFVEAAWRSAASARASTDTLSVAAVPPFVGRRQDLALLERSLAGEGPPVVLITGEPGIGKTRLLQEAMPVAVARGWHVLAGSCLRWGQPYAPLLGALQQHLRHQRPAQLRADLQGCAWLVRLLPELADGPIEPLPTWTLPPEHERRLMGDALVRFLRNVAGRAGTVLVLDDLQWAGPDAVELLATLARRAAEGPLRVLIAYRDTEMQGHEPLSALLIDLAQARLATRLALAPLSRGEAAHLLDGLLSDGDDVRTDLRERVLERASGLPYYVVSWAQGRRWRPMGQPEEAVSQEDAVPWDVAQSIQQRVAALPLVTQTVLHVAAVLGSPVHPTLLLAVLARPEEEILDALEGACRSHLLVEGAQGYHFAHDVIRTVVDGRLSAARRALLCRRVAQALEADPEVVASGEPPIELLAHFYSLAGVRNKAAQYLEHAGDRALARLAYAAALDYYRAVLQRLDTLKATRDAARVKVKLSQALTLAAQYEEALEVLEQAAEAYRLTGDLEKLGDVAGQMATLHVVRGTPEEGLRRLEPLQAFLEAQRSAPALAGLYPSLLHLLFATGRYSTILGHSERAAEMARVAHHELAWERAQSFRAAALLMLGQVREAMRMAAAHSGATHDVGYSDFLANAHLFQGNIARSRHYAQVARAVAEQSGDPREIAFAVYRGGIIAFYTGEWDLARQEMERAVAMMRQVGRPYASVYVLLGLGRLCVAEGQWTEAVPLLEEAHALAVRSGDLQGRRWASRQWAEWELLQGHPEAAHARLLPLLDRSESAEFDVTYLLPMLAWAYLDMGALDQAAETLAQAVARMRAEQLRLMLAEALWVQARIGLRLKQVANVVGALEEGIALARAMPYPWAEARLLHVYGLLHLHLGGPAAARSRLAAALAIFHRLGACWEATHVEQAMQEMPSSVPL